MNVKKLNNSVRKQFSNWKSFWENHSKATSKFIPFVLICCLNCFNYIHAMHYRQFVILIFIRFKILIFFIKNIV